MIWTDWMYVTVSSQKAKSKAFCMLINMFKENALIMTRRMILDQYYWSSYYENQINKSWLIVIWSMYLLSRLFTCYASYVPSWFMFDTTAVLYLYYTKIAIWTKHSTLIFENLKIVELSKNHYSTLIFVNPVGMSKNNNFISVEHLQKLYWFSKLGECSSNDAKWFFDFSTGFRFSKISVECSDYICSCPWLHSTH